MNTPDSEFSPLIKTKLYRPHLPVDLVPRPHLTAWLDERSYRPLTLVSAPAGYGKSTLISSWLDTCNYPHTWLTLDSQDNDLVVFLTYFLEAIRIIFPEAAQKTYNLLNAQTQPPVKSLAAHLANEINQLEKFFVLVLDDFEVIQNVAVHDFFNEFLLHPPRNFHLVICTRIDPSISIQKLRAQSLLTEIRAQDLRFTPDESYDFLQKVLGSTIEIRTAEELDQQSEGWVTGLRLAALALRHRVGKRSVEPNPIADNIYVTDYLMAEILEHQMPDTAEWMLKTSILGRFNAGLCEAVCREEQSTRTLPEGTPYLDGKRFLEWLVSSNLFSIPLDDYNRWVRYHHLFKDFLQSELSRQYNQTEITQLHVRASEWFGKQGLIDEALHHALEADDLSAAARLVEQNARLLLDNDQWHLLEKWVSRIPDSIIQVRPALLLARAWILFYHFALLEIPSILETVEMLLDEDEAAQPLLGEVDFFWGHHWFWQGQKSHSLPLFERALKRIPEDFQMARGHAELFWGVAKQMAGQKMQAVEALKKWLHDERTSHPIRQTRLLGSLVFIHFLSGELTEATLVAEQIRVIGEKHNNTYLKAWVSYLFGHAYFYWNDPKRASINFIRAVENRFFLHARAAIDSLVGLALTYQVLGDAKSANTTLIKLHDFAQEINNPAYVSIACSCQARISLLQGDLASAVHWIGMADLTIDTNIMFYWLEIPRITDCRVLIAQGTPASLNEATLKLKHYEQQNADENNIHQLIEIYLLETVAFQKQSQSELALAALERAITLTQPDGWIRPFSELGHEIIPLLTMHITQHGSSDYTHKLLSACQSHADTVISRSIQPPSEIIEPLTDREFEILNLLRERLTNKEIAAELFITIGTVQQHLNHIYAKLNVRGRRQAIAKATELAILTPHR